MGSVYLQREVADQLMNMQTGKFGMVTVMVTQCHNNRRITMSKKSKNKHQVFGYIRVSKREAES